MPGPFDGHRGRGLVLEKLEYSSPFHSASVGVDKAAITRRALAWRKRRHLPATGRLTCSRGWCGVSCDSRADFWQMCYGLGEGFWQFSRGSEIASELA
jgi:hypothetical protein